ncbi:glycosyltransferase family 2 protein [Compostibacter hankyongensis]|uniref:Glycosyltransferase family A protein n=1 Tax=Compostibacter hankyongensis TaxID=1007089 RepID=A0ABP8FW65_9BACT
MKVSVLIPTVNRPTALAATLMALVVQSFGDFEITIADQSRTFIRTEPTIQTISRIFELHDRPPLHILQNLPPRGIAQQRQFLLNHSTGTFSLFLDDDVILEPRAISRLVQAMEEEECGFGGMAPVGLSYREDVRTGEQEISWWNGRVQPERVRPEGPGWERYKLHSAANMLHIGEKLRASGAGQKKYKVAWIGGCVLYDTAKLRDTGGFEFWQKLPPEHCGEDVLAQLRLMEKYGGFGLVPSGAYHQELPTTIANREVNAPEYLLAAR